MKVKPSAIRFPNMFFRAMRAGLVLVALTLMYVPSFADEKLSDDRIKQLALEAIMENPEIIQLALQRLERLELERQQANMGAILTDRHDQLERDENAPVLGNPNGDVTIVEFFDYNCPYCRRVKPEMAKLLEQDKNVRLVYREWPILGPGSVFAARAALASRKQGKYEEFHWALMGLQRRAGEPIVLEIANSIGLDIEQLQKDMEDPEIESHIALSMELAQGLNITGTPSFVIGNSIAPGLVKADRLIEMVNQARLEKQ